jgi:protease II
MTEQIVNRVAQSGLITVNLEDFHVEGTRTLYDIKDNLWQEIALKEKDFRAFVKENDWSKYQDHLVALHCSVDAIVPTWAYMLLSAALKPFAKSIAFGDLATLETILFEQALQSFDAAQYEGARVVIKGCGDIDVPASAYVKLTDMLLPVAKTIMYGEPCSTVPIYKRPK